MGGLLNIVLRLSNWMHAIAAAALTFIMLLTVCDVVSRFFGRPIVGTFELVGLGGAVIIGFGIPITSWNRGHILCRLFDQLVSQRHQRRFQCGNKVDKYRAFYSYRVEPFHPRGRSNKIRRGFHYPIDAFLSSSFWFGSLLLHTVPCAHC